MRDAASTEAVAVALYESDCRANAGDMARRTTLSRIRAHYAFPAYAQLTPRERNRWRVAAGTMLAEQTTARDDDLSWEGGRA